MNKIDHVTIKAINHASWYNYSSHGLHCIQTNYYAQTKFKNQEIRKRTQINID